MNRRPRPGSGTAARPDAAHAMLLPGRHDELARELFCGSLTNHLETVARPRLRRLFERVVAPRLGAERANRRAIAREMRRLPATRAWYALRTAAQRLSYRSSAAVIARQHDALQRRARDLQAADAPATLALDPALEIPRYVGGREIHLMPGGYCAERDDDDLAAGALFDRQMTVNRLGSQGALNDDPGASLVALLQARFPAFQPRRILELGCTVGHNLLPFKLGYPQAEVWGIDVSAPCLRYAAARARALGVAVHFSQQDAERTVFPDGHFDLVFSRILMHETSAHAVPRILAESRRLLRPGGLTLHSDAPQFDELDPYTASLRDWDIRCNEEPFMDRWYALPVERLLQRAGFPRGGIFRDWAPSLHVARTGIDPRLNRSGGRYFLVGALAARPASRSHS